MVVPDGKFKIQQFIITRKSLGFPLCLKTNFHVPAVRSKNVFSSPDLANCATTPAPSCVDWNKTSVDIVLRSIEKKIMCKIKIKINR